MPERVVVSFNVGRGSTSRIPRRREETSDPSGGPGYLERAVALKKQAEALGARLCAWSAQTFSFEFEPDEIEEAIVQEDGTAALHVAWPGDYELSWFVRHASSGIDFPVEQKELSVIRVADELSLLVIEVRLGHDELARALLEAGG